MKKIRLLMALGLMMIGLSASMHVKAANDAAGAKAPQQKAGTAQVYTVFTEDGVLTYYYDDQMASRTGIVAGYNTTGTGFDNNDLYDICDQVTKAVIDPSMKEANLSDMSYLFMCKLVNDSKEGYFTNMTSIEGIENLNTANVMSMSWMFESCESLTSLDLTGFDVSKVYDMRGMFYGCENLTTIYCEDDWSSSSVLKYSEDMFKDCKKLKGGRGTTYSAYFTDATFACPDGGGDRGYFTSRKAYTTTYVEFKDGVLTYYHDDQIVNRTGIVAEYNVGGTGFNNNDLYDICDQVTKAVIDPSMKEANLWDMNYLFMCKLVYDSKAGYFTNMTSIEGIENLNTANVMGMSWMFGLCKSLTSLDLTGFDVSKVYDMRGMFYGCENLTTIYCDDAWNPSSSDDMFGGCTSLVGGKGTTYDAAHIDATYARPDKGASEPGYFTSKNAVPQKKVYTEFKDGVLTYYYDDQMASRTGIVEEYDPINKPEAHRFADYHEQVTKAVIDASMQEAPLTSTQFMFHGRGYELRLSNMTSIEGLENLNTANVTNMSYMFDNCQALTSLDLSHFNTANVTDMSTMFQGCESLTHLDVSHFNTVNVTDMSFMFSTCYTLSSLDLSSFNTAKVTTMYYMFQSCAAFTSLDVSNFDISNVEYMSGMFSQCDNLTTIYCNEDWSQSTALKMSDDMFFNCKKLKGGKGTTYDAAHIDATYARPDKAGQPGYFTLSGEKAVEALIDAIGEVEYTAESKAKIDEAREAYDALTAEQKAKVSNYAVLQEAEARYNTLKAEAELADVITELQGLCEYSIELTSPGTFALAMVEAMGEHTWVDIKHLCVSGPMNDTDLSYLAQAVNAVTIDLHAAQFEHFGACSSFKSLEKIVLPPSCKTLNKEAFYRCEKLTYINLGEVETFGEQTFMYCSLLPEVDLHSAKTLGHRVFEYCSSLTSVSLPEATYVGTQCFVGCTNLESASLPKATTIGGSAFSSLTKLKKVELCDDIEKFEGGQFSGCTALKSIKLPAKLRYIGSNTFYNSITDVEGEWPKGLEYIGSGNFNKMNYMVIGPAVTMLYSAVNTWQNIYCYAADPQAFVTYHPFPADKVGNTTLYVPRSSLNAYKLNQEYANFLHIYALEDAIDELHIHSPYMMLSTEKITEDAQLILHADAAMTTSAPTSLKVGSYEQYIHLGPKQYTSNKVTEDGVQVTHYYTNMHHTGILYTVSPVSSDDVAYHLIPMHKQWNFLMLPFDVSVQDISIWTRGQGKNENGTPGVSQFVFREYSGANRASGNGATWNNVPEDGVLKANTGYILYWVVEGGTNQTNYYPGVLSDEFIYYFRFPAMHTENLSNIFATGDVQVPLMHYSSEFPQNVSWNLIGNPYPCMFDIRETDFDAPMTMWDGSKYVAFSPIDDGYTLRPGEAFFVQAPDEANAVTFYKEGRYDATKIEIDAVAYQLQHMLPARHGSPSRKLYNFILSDGNNTDRARLVLNDEASESYDLHRDAAKMLSTDAGVPQLWIEAGGVRYAINECPAKDSYRMGAFIGAEGEYTITLAGDEAQTIWLTDLQTGIKTNLSQGAYTFTAEAGMYEGRFLISFGANAPTGLEDLSQEPTANSQKLLENGNLYILHNGTMYNVMGGKVEMSR